MKTYRIILEECISEEFEIQAATAEEARKKAIEKYKKGEFVLTSGHVTYRQAAAADPDDGEAEWEEF